MNQPAKDDDPLKGKKTGKWSKYGGSVSGLVKEEINRSWCCQTCGEEMPKELKPFSYEIAPGEFIRICARCTNIAKKNNITSYTRIITIVRKTEWY